MEPVKLIVVAGARPNFMKIAPLMKELAKYPDLFKPLLVHTGQHYDFKMSDVFFNDLGIPTPDIFLNMGAGSHAVQTAAIMTAFEKVLLEQQPKMVIVVGDVNSTLACSLVASKMNIKVAHVEAGLRSFDRGMPEELNRIVTDGLSDFLFVSEESGLKNLKREGVDPKKVFFSGNIMIDTLLQSMPLIRRSDVLKKLSLTPKSYCVITLHRPSNVDSREALAEILQIFKSICEKTKIVYPIHPRTQKMMETHGLLRDFQLLENLIMVEPLGYIEFIGLVKEAKFVVTDSGGIQEETTVLKVPCITVRENTERPATIKLGTNILVGRDLKKVLSAARKIMEGKWKKSSVPPFWDGKTAKRIVKIFEKELGIQHGNRNQKKNQPV